MPGERSTPLPCPPRERKPPLILPLPLLGSPLVDSPREGAVCRKTGTSPHEDVGENPPQPQPGTQAPPGPPCSMSCPPPCWDPGGAPPPDGLSVHTLSTAMVSPVDRSHTLAVESSLPVASCRPSGLKATLITSPVWP